MNSIYEYSNLVEPNNEVVLQEVITYIKRGNKIVKNTVTRNFFGEDYVDSSTNETICVVK